MKDVSAEVALMTSVVGENVSSIAQDIADTVWTAVIDEDILKDVPIFSVLARVWAVGSAVRDRLFLRKIAAFLQEAGRISPEERERFRKRLAEEPKFAKQSGEKALLLLDKLSELEKARFMGFALRRFVEGAIDEVILNRIYSALEFFPLWRLMELPKYYFEGSIASIDQFSAAAYQQLDFVAIYYGDKQQRLHCDPITGKSYYVAYHQPFYSPTDIGEGVATVVRDYLNDPS